jgi:hypothetical protein
MGKSGAKSAAEATAAGRVATGDKVRRQLIIIQTVVPELCILPVSLSSEKGFRLQKASYCTVKLNFIRSFYRSLCYITASFGHLSLYVPPPLSETSDKSLRIKLISSLVLEGLPGVGW